MSDLISRCELFNRLATIPAPPEANDFKAEIYKVIQGMETEQPHVVAQINLDKDLVVEEVMQRIKEEYELCFEWIPCSERLPNEDEQDSELGVLVTLGNGYNGLQYDWYHDDHWYDWDGYIIAWCPLPAPYKEGGGQ